MGWVLFNEYKISVRDDEKVPKKDGDNVYTAMWMYY